MKLLKILQEELHNVRIAKSEEIKKLRNEQPKLLENMTLSDLLNEISPKKKTTNSDKKPK